MIVSRTVAMGARALRTAPLRANMRRARFWSSSAASQAAKTGGSSGLVGGIAGGALVFVVSEIRPNWP
jgi:predicted lipid-binding transport protein (Tim44 family)